MLKANVASVFESVKREIKQVSELEFFCQFCRFSFSNLERQNRMHWISKNQKNNGGEIRDFTPISNSFSFIVNWDL
jgi:hypothetical protein